MDNFNAANAGLLAELRTAYEEMDATSHWDADLAVVKQLSAAMQPLALTYLRQVVLGPLHYSATDVEHAENMLIVLTHHLPHPH